MLYKSYLIEQDIKKIKEDLFLFYGENLGLKNDFKKKIRIESKEKEVLIFDQDQLINNENLLLNELRNISLFKNNKIFFINNVNDKLMNLVETLDQEKITDKIFFFSGILDKKSKLRNHFEKSKKCGVSPCYADNEASIKKIILNSLRDFQNLNTVNINLIVENVGNDRIKLNNELQKITSLFEDRKLDTEKLVLLLDPRLNQDFNNLKDEALLGNTIKTNKLLSNTSIDTEKNIYYLTLINQRLTKLSELNLKAESSNITSAVERIKPPIFWKDKTNIIEQAKKWNKNKINHILKKTCDLEIQIKSNIHINKNILLKNLIIDICRTANS